MSNRQKRNKRQRATKKKLEDVPLTPMIDVVFQMLIYFVVTFEIPDRLTEMKVWRPQGENSAPTENAEPPDNITI
jgi:biopolymer transport protein ExbD